MSAQRVLVVGGGPAGMAAAIAFTRRGAQVLLVEIDANWAASGVGLTLLGPTLRVLDELGVADDCVQAGFAQDRADFRNVNGDLTAVVPFPRVAADRLPPAVCITRPLFHRVLARHTVAAGVDVRLGVTVAALEPSEGGAAAELSDGTHERFDLVVAADGLHSRVRALVFDGVPAPRFTGQAVWRTLVPRPPSLDVYQMYYGRRSKFGLVPVSDDGLYVFAVQNVTDVSKPARERQADLMRELLDADGELVDGVRNAIVDPAEVNYRPTEAMLVPAPWHRGAVVLVGDAAHTTTPHLAFGAGIAVEDSVVLSEVAAGEGGGDGALDRYVARRYARCRLVVENSVQLGAWEQDPGNPDADPARLTRESWDVLREPL